MKTVTYDDVVAMEPCWLETPQGRRRLRYYAKKRERWTALDVLRLPRVSAEDRLWLVLRPELIDEPVLHEYACRCAEYAMKFVADPDPRSVAAIDAKRRWVRGEIGDNDLMAARAAAWDAARVAAGAAARAAARAAAWDAARAAAWAAAGDAAWNAAGDAAWNAARDAAWAAAHTRGVQMLIDLLKEVYHVQD